MKLKLPKKVKKPDVPTTSLGTLDELRDRNHLETVRKSYRKNDAIENYCELLETQIHSLVDKLLPLHDEHIQLKKKYEKLKAMFNDKAYNSTDTGKVQKQRDKLRVHINNAVNELSQAQQFSRDNIDQ